MKMRRLKLHQCQQSLSFQIIIEPGLHSKQHDNVLIPKDQVINHDPVYPLQSNELY